MIDATVAPKVGLISSFGTTVCNVNHINALLEVYGVWDTPPRQGPRGRLPKPRRYPPPDLCYAVVVKERAHGRVVHVTTRLVYGTTEQVETALRMSPVSRTITTYGVERQNLTVRQHSRRMGRKVNAFSKDPDYLEEQLTVAFAYYHFVIPHRRPTVSPAKNSLVYFISIAYIDRPVLRGHCQEAKIG
jgi:hypothetical protein